MATWPEIVQKVGKWYEANVHTYQTSSNGRSTGTRKWYNSPWGKAGDDCTAYVSTCLQVLGVFPKGYAPGSASFAAQMSDCGRKLSKGGFQCIPFSWATVRPYDIISVFKNGGSHHAEIYAGNNRSWSWGAIHDNLHNKGGMPCGTAKLAYQVIWRHNGTNIDVPIYSGDPTMQDQLNMQYGGGLYGQQENNSYPVHDEYVTITQQYGNIFENSEDNAITVASLTTDASWFLPDSSVVKYNHVRIYSTNDSSIVLDELSLPLYHKGDNYANKGILGDRERDNMARIDRSLYETTDASTGLQNVSTAIS